jgi:hypothetical protein
MGIILGKIKVFIAVVLACSVSSVPSCSGMGGGMRHLIDVPAVSSPSAST